MLFSRLFQSSSTCFYPISAINEQSSIKKISRKHPPSLKLWRTGEISKTPAAAEALAGRRKIINH